MRNFSGLAGAGELGCATGTRYSGLRTPYTNVQQRRKTRRIREEWPGTQQEPVATSGCRCQCHACPVVLDLPGLMYAPWHCLGQQAGAGCPSTPYGGVVGGTTLEGKEGEGRQDSSSIPTRAGTASHPSCQEGALEDKDF